MHYGLVLQPVCNFHSTTTVTDIFVPRATSMDFKRTFYVLRRRGGQRRHQVEREVIGEGIDTLLRMDCRVFLRALSICQRTAQVFRERCRRNPYHYYRRATLDWPVYKLALKSLRRRGGRRRLRAGNYASGGGSGRRDVESLGQEDQPDDLMILRMLIFSALRR